jgi:hypothetical protein
MVCAGRDLYTRERGSCSRSLNHFNSRTLHAIVFQSAKQFYTIYTTGIDEDRKCSFRNTSSAALGLHNGPLSACGAGMSSLG